jgi:hypothetical protein
VSSTSEKGAISYASLNYARTNGAGGRELNPRPIDYESGEIAQRIEELRSASRDFTRLTVSRVPGYPVCSRVCASMAGAFSTQISTCAKDATADGSTALTWRSRRSGPD